MSDLIRDVARQLDVPHYGFTSADSDAELSDAEREEADATLAIMNLTRQADALGLDDGE